ncbi:hypothetical protein [Aeromonas veronii]
MYDLNPIGGYNQISLPNNSFTLHDTAYNYQSARACLYAHLKHRKPSAVYIPNYICESIIRPIKELGIEIKIYEINNHLLPSQISFCNENESFLIVNYFGLLTKSITKIVSENKANFIVDNSQALFEPPIPNAINIYSLRKFISVPDGGFLYTEQKLKQPDEEFEGERYLSHLFLRAAGLVEKGYNYFLESEKALENCIPRKMSSVSKYILTSIDIHAIKKSRVRNFCALDDEYKNLNTLSISQIHTVPLCYPLKLSSNVDYIHSELIKKRIFLPRYWKSEFNGPVGEDMYDSTLFLPIDERLSMVDLNRLISIVNSMI